MGGLRAVRLSFPQRDASLTGSCEAMLLLGEVPVSLAPGVRKMPGGYERVAARKAVRIRQAPSAGRKEAVPAVSGGRPASDPSQHGFPR